MKIGANAVLSFALEIAALVIYGWAPFAYFDFSLIVEVLLAVIAVAIFVLLWARFAAPRSATRLKGMALVCFKLLVLLPAVVLVSRGRSGFFWAIGFVLVFVCVILEYRQGPPLVPVSHSE